MAREKGSSMKNVMRILIFLLVLSITDKGFADAGFAYRFFLKITNDDGETSKGSFYFGSWEEYGSEKSLLDFVKENSNIKELEIFPEILTLKISQSDLDFTDKNSSVKIKISNVVNIQVIEFLSYVPNQRLVLLNEDELNILFRKGLNFSSLYFKDYEIIVAENCIDILLSDKTKEELDYEAEIFSKKLRDKVEELNYSLEMENGDVYFNFFRQEKKKLLKKGIVVFTIWYAL
ncbi:hypothetical protein SAMN04489761_3812 [Tenacibaculum sp. MAR_2009_124]|uniref:hypothetical protein n=1 Tax=Tenacibaculum sp. MAR_2009_124 TaxID=1250059 RepID=UPI00089C8A5A|nr:hypothetical protein [Tenacibaculum sp. MAR_2009_124]SEC86631.1 hypothetical protein SAMN04489761_3812 [Tenacibaculum sp. MAR_2009_124]